MEVGVKETMIKDAFTLIGHVNQTINLYGKYNALFFVAILFLFLKKQTKNTQGKTMESEDVLFFLSFSGLLLVANPLIIAFFIKVLPYFANYWQTLWVIPGFYLIAQAGATLFAQLGYQKKLIVMGIVVIALAGTIVPYQSPRERCNNLTGIPAAELAVFERLKENYGEDEISLLAPEEILQTARSYSAQFMPSYEVEQWSTDLGTDFSQTAALAARLGSDSVVLPISEEEQTRQYQEIFLENGFRFYKATEEYAIFIRG